MATAERERRWDVGWWIDSGGILVMTAVLGTTAGAVGLAIGGGLLAIREWSSAIMAFTLGQLALVLVPQLTALPLLFVVVEAGIACLLVESTSRLDAPWRATLGLGGVGSTLAAIAAGGWRSIEASWLVGLVLIIVVAVAAYGLHRYERVRLDLVGST